LQEQILSDFERRRAPPPEAPATPVFNPLDAVNVTLRVDDADVRFVFKAIADQANLNLVLPSSLTTRPRNISLALRDMPASQVFEHVLRAVDMHGTVDRGVMQVSEHQERVFNLDFLQTSITANFNAGGDVFGANQSVGGAQGGGSDVSQSGIRNGFNLRGQNTNDNDPYTPIEALLKTVIGSHADASPQPKEAPGQATEAVTPRLRDGARYVLNRSTGTLYVKASPSQVATIAQQVEQYRNVLGRQVLIEAQILDIELNDEFQYGVDWARLRNNAAISFGVNPMTLSEIVTSVPGAANPGQSLTLPARTLGTPGVGSAGLAYGRPNQSIAINLLKTFGAVHVLSNPSLRVKNTQPAVVSVGRTERYVAQTTSNLSDSGGGQRTVSANVITGNLFDGVMLGVIPFVGDDGVISLMINPVQTTIRPGSSDLINVGTAENPQRISLPKVDFKGITTSLSLRDGDMVILGGLIGESGNRSKAGLPGIAEIPVLGEAMGSVNRSLRSRELVVVLRVRIL
jgi:MSHA type pilus biogenesis protein MshL